MRVVAGTLGGRRLVAPGGDATRPTSELIRGAIFNSLASRDLIDGASVADLFAGSGALGIEALSRGAASAVLVESDRMSSRTAAANIASLGLDGVAAVVVADAVAWVEARRSGPLDLVLIDPPYRFDEWDRLLAGLVTFPARFAVCESDRPIGGAGWDVLGVKRHGGTVVSHLRSQGAS
ncbi:MAG: hypothetical protein NVS3B12_10100 [Acidimicrobiales bacterium]